MNAVVEKPTSKAVKAACERFDRENALAEQALAELFRQYPRNGDIRHILLKVVAVNALEHTHIFPLDAVARHIHADIPEIDSALAEGSPEIIQKIAKVAIHGKHYNLYSFATKYCNRHNPGAYPVYDLRIEHALCAIQKHSPFAAFSHTDLCHYPRFVSVLAAFRDVHGLGAFSFEQIGKFLHIQGEPPAPPLQEEVETGPGTFDFFPAHETVS